MLGGCFGGKDGARSVLHQVLLLRLGPVCGVDASYGQVYSSTLCPHKVTPVGFFNGKHYAWFPLLSIENSFLVVTDRLLSEDTGVSLKHCDGEDDMDEHGVRGLAIILLCMLYVSILWMGSCLGGP